MPGKIGVVLSGCGVYDGSEIHEAVITLLAIDRGGAEAVVCAPDVAQMHVINHLTLEVEPGATRNVLVESARIARGCIRDVAHVSADELDGLVLPGGYGAAKNICDFVVSGRACTVHPEVARIVRAVHAQGKPIAALCIAPAVLARLLGSERPLLTIGDDAEMAADLEAMGARHVRCPATEITVDHETRLVTTPAYMRAQRISEAAEGIEKAVDALLHLALETAPEPVGTGHGRRDRA
jgi:enhancing lycopene biosynthesis protein 2